MVGSKTIFPSASLLKRIHQRMNHPGELPLRAVFDQASACPKPAMPAAQGGHIVSLRLDRLTLPS
jgi:hypothetical protein